MVMMELLAAGRAEPVSLAEAIWSLVCLFFTIAVHWKLFEKAGEPGWKTLIPIYNIYIFYKMTWGKDRAIIPMIPVFVVILAAFLSPILMAMMFLYFHLLAILAIALSIAALVLWIITVIKLADCFAKGASFAVGLFFLYPIFSAMLAFGNMDYYEPW